MLLLCGFQSPEALRGHLDPLTISVGSFPTLWNPYFVFQLSISFEIEHWSKVQCRFPSGLQHWQHKFQVKIQRWTLLTCSTQALNLVGVDFKIFPYFHSQSFVVCCWLLWSLGVFSGLEAFDSWFDLSLILLSQILWKIQNSSLGKSYGHHFSKVIYSLLFLIYVVLLESLFCYLIFFLLSIVKT